jgi:hypothetical protein
MITPHQDRPSCIREPLAFVYSATARQARIIAGRHLDADVDAVLCPLKKYSEQYAADPRWPLWVDDNATTTPLATSKAAERRSREISP